jgi:hypothetical protein
VVEFPHQHAVEGAITRMVHQGIELRATLTPTRNPHVHIIPHDLQPGALSVGPSPVELQIGFLIRRADPEVECGSVLLEHLCLDHASEKV